ncbi:E3 ubiquitin ligase BIG BROTHER-related-like [Cornus florida]|uniref:E3 ubiquitin ligase BIG BROTHER-related-like n=1 Tax=Cornus florida TaxID=4283 RepID=UPI0028A19464|nr:E3 ubiquitin ligase BIG BROTHER-related-like [Cornus florida]
MAVVERIRKAEIRVFEWNERIFNNEDSEFEEGMLMLRVSTDVVGEVNIDFRTIKVHLFPFRLDNLVPRESLESLFDLSTQSQNVFLLDSNDRILSAHIIKYLVSHFQFTATVNSFSSRKSKIVVVVDISAESTSVFNTGSCQDFPNEEEEEEEWEYGNVEDEEQEMVSSTTLSMEENQDHEEDEDMDNDSTDLNVEEHEVDCVDDLEQETEDEDLMDYNNSVSNIVDEESYFAEVPRNDHLKILRILRSDVGESIPGDEPIFFFKEIETAVKVNRLNDDHTSPSVDHCSICLQGFLTGTEIATTPCSHIFHHDCLRTWLPKNNSCPMCRSLCATIVHI